MPPNSGLQNQETRKPCCRVPSPVPCHRGKTASSGVWGFPDPSSAPARVLGFHLFHWLLPGTQALAAAMTQVAPAGLSSESSTGCAPAGKSAPGRLGGHTRLGHHVLSLGRGLDGTCIVSTCCVASRNLGPELGGRDRGRMEGKGPRGQGLRRVRMGRAAQPEGEPRCGDSSLGGSPAGGRHHRDPGFGRSAETGTAVAEGDMPGREGGSGWAFSPALPRSPWDRAALAFGRRGRHPHRTSCPSPRVPGRALCCPGCWLAFLIGPVLRVLSAGHLLSPAVGPGATAARKDLTPLARHGDRCTER